MAEDAQRKYLIRETTREALLDAIARFDRDPQSTSLRKRWEGDQFGAHTVAISHDGRLYPVREIIRLATGLGNDAIPGGGIAYDYVESYGFPVIFLRRQDEPRVWWVNQGQAYDEERLGGFIHAPLKDGNGVQPKHWRFLANVVEGDLIVHYRAGAIRAIGRALDHYQMVPLEDGRQARQVPVEYADLLPTVPLESVASRIHALGLTDGPLVQDGTTPKQGYLWPFSMEGLRIIRDASASAWPAWAEPQTDAARAWIFQADPQRFEVLSAVRELTEITWLIRQHAAEMEPGDRVFLWVPGPDSGIVAVGTLRSRVEQRPVDPSEVPFYTANEPLLDVQPRVRLRIDDVLGERVRRAELEEHSVLRDLSIIQLGSGTVFKVTPDQAASLVAVAAEHSSRNLTPPADDGDAEPSPLVTFDALLSKIEGDGLYFPTELVANYLLALQTKRFVILTGISGTGKTQLAMAVAKAFQPQVRVAVPRIAGEGAVEIKVQPYMVKYHRFTLPAIVRTNLTLPTLDPEKNSALIEVNYPAGRAKQRFYRDPDRPVTELLLGDKFRAWFESELQVGDTFHLDVVPHTGDGDGGDQLRISLPVADRREELLDNHRVIAVRPDWTDNRGLLGYHNPLAERYVTTPLLDLLLQADAECVRAVREGRPPHPFFLILDEMNLAHVEHYFSDFLSAMESGAPMDLHADALIESGEGAENTPMPRRITIPRNVFFTGTVNVDETTSMFSPKVLDRAFTIELDQVDLAGYGFDLGTVAAPPVDAPPEFHLPDFPGSLTSWRPPNIEDWKAFGQLLDGELRKQVVAIHTLLTASHRHFGFRVANEIARYITLAAEQADEDGSALRAALDLAVLQKVLPKFHGTQQELEAPLMALFRFLVLGTADTKPAVQRSGYMLQGGRLRRVDQAQEPAPTAEAADGAEESGEDTVTAQGGDSGPAFPRSAAKVWRMLDRLQQQGFTSFIE